ncbi:MAG TPA: hypothetical protein VLH75_00820 [Longimicrobiales bacterium]|nr:hypothetical protein [Longimicrobiales bacterium]
MILRLLVLVLSLGLPGAPSHGGADAPASAPRADTLIRTDLGRVPRAVAAGLAADEDAPHARLGLRRIPMTSGGALAPVAPPLLFGLTSGEAWASRLVRQSGPEALLAGLLRTRVAEWGRSSADTAFFLPAAPVAPSPGAAAVGDELPRFVTDFADLALRVRSRMELGGDWSRYTPCDPQLKISCTPTLIPQLSPDVQFGVQVAGTILDRVAVDVDFDQVREFDAANRINIVYHGAEDAILRRLEVGDVTFRLPASRFFTEGIPAGNFGFQAEGQLGPLDFQTVWAQQRGDLNSREFRLTGLGDQRAFMQEDTLVLDDADYVRGQFFFLVDPRAIDRYPHVDALALDAGSAPPTLAPGADPIQLYRFEDDPVLRQQVQGFIQADAEAEGPGGPVVESGWFRYLQPGVDYFVHPSGLWIALRTPLRREEMLAVTYITATGDTVGDYNPERIHNLGGRARLRLLRASGANHQPGRPTWDLEMHQIYRVSGSPDVEQASVTLTLSLGELSAGRTFKRAPSGDDLTFLRLLGLDEESPLDQLDPAFVYAPGSEAFEDEPPVQGTFVVLPTLRPFAEPPPVPSLGLGPEETAAILGDDANRRIYDEEDPFERDNAGLFRLTLAYRIRSEGVISSFSLGALGIRPESERVWLGDRLLARGVDYEIDYDVGQVTLLEPEQLFTASPDAVVRATWEQRSLFQVQPTQVFGLSTHSALGDWGSLDFLTLYQAERTVVTRPQLGTEPGGALTGGISGSAATHVAWFDRLLDRLPGLRFDGTTSLSLGGEVGVSLPNPNTRGTAFVDDFDAAAELPVSLVSSEWALGSAPSSPEGAAAALPPAPDASTSAPLTWQHQWVVESLGGDSVGVHEGFFPRQEIDRQIRVAGSEAREPGLLLSFGRPQQQRPAWRSFTTSLATTGLDLTKTDFLEFYVAGGEALTLVLDLGSVSEDALFLDAAGRTSGSRPETGDPWGLGVLDQEADPRLGEIWNSAADAVGVWNESCSVRPGEIYRPGDPRSNCTRGNGRRDSEDLDGDGNLDVQERHLRYVVRLDGMSPYLARTRAETGTEFQLYRIPLRGTDAVEVGGAVGEADLRAVKHLRVTVTGSRSQRLRLARMRLVGSRWIKRGGEGILAGLGGDTLLAGGRLEVASVSRVTEGDAYASPPGVLEELVDPTTAYAGQGIEFNEKALGLSFEGIPSGARAEVYHRFPQRPRNFLEYRQARVWVVTRSGDLGPDRANYFFLKVGTDAENFYLFRSRLSAPAGPAGVTPGDWLPEMVVDFQEWFELRQRAEEEINLSPPGPGDPPVTLWSADSAYAVVLRDRGRAPDLAHVRELSLGVMAEGPLPLSGEIWIDELRLGRPVRDAGVASSMEAVLDAAGVLSSRVTWTSRGSMFRQLRDEATYQTDRSLSVSSTLRLDRWAPAEWGIDLPLTFGVDRTSQDPTFLLNSDVRADRIRNLRPTDARRTRVGLSFRKSTRTANPWVGFVMDGLDARVGYTATRGSTVTTESEVDAVSAGVGWVREPRPRAFAVVPAFAEGALKALLPAFLEEQLLGARFRWTPERVSMGTSYLGQDSRTLRFERIIQVAGDTLAVATLAPRQTVESAADVRLRPLQALDAAVTLLSTRDLLAPDEAVSDPRVQVLLRRERGRVAGMDIGWETNRTVRTRLGFRPRVFSWLRSDVDWTSAYGSDRAANFLLRSVEGTDTVLTLTRSAQGQRDWRALLALDPGVLAASVLGAAAAGEDPGITGLRRILGSLRPLSFSYRDGLVSRFHRDPVDPGLGYQFGWGDTDDFRFLEGDTAATLTDQASWTWSSGIRTAGGGSVDVAYQRSRASTLDTRSDRTTNQRRWPDLRASLPPLTLPAFTLVQRVTLSGGYAEAERETVYGGRGLQRRFESEVQVPVDVTVSWRGTLVTTYRGSFRAGEAEDPTGLTDRTQSSHRLSVSSQLLPPGRWAARLDRPVRFSLLAGYTAERDCRTTVTQSACVPFLDQIRRSLSVSLDTSVRGFEMGMQMSWDDRQSFVGQRNGSSQFQLGVFGQLQFSAGTLPRATPR